MYRNVIYTEYKKRLNDLLMEGEDVGDMNFPGYFKKRKLDCEQIEKQIEKQYIYSETDSENEDADSDDEDADNKVTE